MSFFLTGNLPINSTFAPVTDPSTTTLLAELDSSNIGPTRMEQRTFACNVHVGGSTGGYWVVEHATSTTISAGAVRDRLFLRTASGQTSQFVWKIRFQASTDRVRVRHVSSVTGVFEAKLGLEALD